MNIKQEKKIFYLFSIMFIIIVFFLLGYLLSNKLIKNTTFDITSDKIYSLSKSTKTILNDLDTEITLYFFVSPTNNNSQIKDYADRIKIMLNQYVKFANGKIKLEVINPVAFSKDEDKALSFSINPIIVNNQPFYLGIAAISSDLNKVQVIRFFEPHKEKLLEYDLTYLIYKANLGRNLKVGFATNLPITGAIEKATGKQIPSLYIYQQISAFYDTELIDLENPTISNDLDVLIVALVGKTNKELTYAIEQYAFQGGKVMFIMDPLVNSFGNGSFDNNLNKLVANFGLAVEPQTIIAELEHSQNIVLNNKNVKHLGVFVTINQQKNLSDPIMTGINNVIFSSAGVAFATRNLKKQDIKILFRTSSNAYLVIKNTFDRLIEGNLDSFLPRAIKAPKDGFPLVIKAKAHKVNSLFENENFLDNQHKSFGENIQYMLITDADFLFDNFWLAKTEKRIVKIAQNDSLILNSIDFLAGSKKLALIRNKGSYLRNFTLINKIRDNTQDKLIKQENKLMEELQKTEQEIKELEKTKRDNNLILTFEQQQAIINFQTKRNNIRIQLRRIKKQQNDSLIVLEQWLKFFNIWFVPLLLIVAIISFLSIRKYLCLTSKS